MNTKHTPMTPQPTLLPFDLAKALAGARVVTRHGLDVTEITHDGGELINGYLEGTQCSWFQDGRRYNDGRTWGHDLFLLAAQEAGAVDDDDPHHRDCFGCNATLSLREGCEWSEDPKLNLCHDCALKAAGQRDPNDDDELKAAREEIKRLHIEARKWHQQLVLTDYAILGNEDAIQELSDEDPEYAEAAKSVCLTHARDLRTALEGRVKEFGAMSRELGRLVIAALPVCVGPIFNEDAKAALEKLNALLRPATAGQEVQP
jgi:hypothetical protein